MNDVLGWIIVIFTAISAAMMVNIGLTDYRNFDKIVKACETVGHIQDTKTRVFCGVEKPTDRN